MRLSELRPAPGSRSKPKRVGRGEGSGLGRTAGRGNKGQRARSGEGKEPGFEGGQMPLQRRLPKRGFTNIFKKRYAVVNLSAIAEKFEPQATIDAQALLEAGVIKRVLSGVRVLGKGEIDRPLTFKVAHVSEGARRKIEAAGGKVEVA